MCGPQLGFGSEPGPDLTYIPKMSHTQKGQGAVLDGELHEGERIGPLEVIGVSGKSPGEVAFLWPERKTLIVGDAVVGNPPGHLSLLRERVMDDPARLRGSVKQLLALDFDTILV